MDIITAINAVGAGLMVESCEGRRYTEEMLRPEWYGAHYASFRTCGMTEKERKGAWSIV